MASLVLFWANTTVRNASLVDSSLFKILLITFDTVIFPSIKLTCSRSFTASRNAPSAMSTMAVSASSSIDIFSFLTILASAERSSSFFAFAKEISMQRDRTVAGTFIGSVVAKIKIACAGGSSRVLRSALNASVVIICTSSIMKILYGPDEGDSLILSRSSRTSSIPRLLAASISNTSILDPFAMDVHASHAPHGPFPEDFSQVKSFAMIRAAVVFPDPFGPLKKYAWGSCFFSFERSNSNFPRTATLSISEIICGR